MNRNTNQNNANRARAITIHEIGHGMGFNHSWLTQNAAVNIPGEGLLQSQVSIMSYGGGKNAIGGGAALNPDDVALASRLYPSCFNMLSLTTGAVRGRVLNAAGDQELYGANVLLINTATNRPVLSRISGYATSPPNGDKNGLFTLDGVPPGNYDLLVAARNDAQVSLGNPNPSIDYMRLNAGSTSWPDALASFDSGFARAWVRDLQVQAGELVDVSYVLAGNDRDFDDPDLIDVTARYFGAANYQYYWFDFWSTSPWQLTHRSGYQTEKEYKVRLNPQHHWVKIFGRNAGGGWVVLQGWTYCDYRAFERTMTWNRTTQPIVTPIGLGWWLVFYAEVLDYHFYLQRPVASTGTWVPVRGTSYTTHLTAGQNHYRVLGQYNLSVWPFQVRPLTLVNVVP